MAGEWNTKSSYGLSDHHNSSRRLRYAGPCPARELQLSGDGIRRTKFTEGRLLMVRPVGLCTACRGYLLHLRKWYVARTRPDLIRFQHAEDNPHHRETKPGS